MLVSIVIPHHTESKEMMYNLFSMLYMQIGIKKEDYEILLCNDDKDGTITDFHEWPGMQIKNLECIKVGYPGVSRQVGLDAATGKWILFVDADDAIMRTDLLGTIIGLNENQVDLMFTSFIEESPNGVQYLPMNSGLTWLFGNVYRNGFLKEHGIRFHNDLKWQEDSFFNQMVAAYNPRIVSDPNFRYYVWKWNGNSITRNGGAKYSWEGDLNYVDCFDYLIQELKIRNAKPEYIEKQIKHILVYSWVSTSRQIFSSNKEAIAFLPQIIARIKEFLLKYKNDYTLDKTEFALLARDYYINTCKHLDVFFPKYNPFECIERIAGVENIPYKDKGITKSGLPEQPQDNAQVADQQLLNSAIQQMQQEQKEIPVEAVQEAPQEAVQEEVGTEQKAEQ
jgi:glycosyltransferase involved in cell wall biosynthesis